MKRWEVPAVASDAVSEICTLIGKLRSMRYPTLVVALEDWMPVAVADLEEAAEQSGLRFIDYAVEILKAGTPKVILGAYQRDQFHEWLRAEARECEGLVVVESDELISSWKERDRRDFFLEFLHTESNQSDGLTRAPIVLVSYLASRFALPRSEGGQGIVWSPDAP